MLINMKKAQADENQYCLKVNVHCSEGKWLNPKRADMMPVRSNKKSSFPFMTRRSQRACLA